MVLMTEIALLIILAGERFSPRNLPQPVQAFNQLLVPVDPPPGKKEEYRNQEGKYGREVIIALGEFLGLFVIEKDIQYGKQHTQDGQPALQFPVFIEENVYRRNTNQGNCQYQDPHIEAGG